MCVHYIILKSLSASPNRTRTFFLFDKKNLHFWQSWTLSFLHSHSRVAWQAFFTLALRDCSRWIIARMSCERANSSSPRYAPPAPRFYVRAAHEFFARVSSWEILRANNKICEIARTQGVAKRITRRTQAWRVLWKFFGILLPTSCRIIVRLIFRANFHVEFRSSRDGPRNIAVAASTSVTAVVATVAGSGVAAAWLRRR